MHTLKYLLRYSPFARDGWQGLFGGPRPLNLEIGCGHGHFLLHMAQGTRDENFIGLDLISKLVTKLQRHIAAAGLDNAVALKADVMLALQELFADGQLNSIHINFPDPWPKEKHRRRRVLQENTLPLFERKLGTGGHLHFVTDDAPYAQDVDQLLQGSSWLVPVPAAGQSLVLSKYERKWIAENRPIYRLSYRKKSGFVPQVLELPAYLTAWPLPAPIALGPFFQHFSAWVRQAPDLVLRFSHCYRNPDMSRLLLRVTLAEPGFLPHGFFVELTPAELRLPPASYLPRLLTQQRIWLALAEGIAEMAARAGG